MNTIRIRGLVRTASQVRKELSRPVSAQRKTVLEKQVKSSLQQIDGILKKAGAKVDSLAAPSRKAYLFLSTLDFGAINCSGAAPADSRPIGGVLFKGLRRSLQGILDQWNRALKRGSLNEVYQQIRSRSEELEELIHKDSLSPEQLSRETREIRGWLAYFARREHFEDCNAALRTASPCFHDGARNRPTLPNEVSVRFQPMRSLYRVKTHSNRLLVQLPTPMISFERETFEQLARLALHRTGSKKAIMQTMLDEPYQTVHGELELLGGIADTSKGMWHDLAASFERVNAAYFDGELSQPRLVWSRAFTSRKFGHYEPAHDTVMVSATLDRQDVPPQVVDFIMYHELLHKKLGVVWTNGRQLAHSAEFARQERQYREYDKAQSVLKQLAGSLEREVAPPARCQPAPPAKRYIEHTKVERPQRTRQPRVGRNAPCPCGSGHKYKKCCGR